ncbi:hypothetical protein RDWZM_010032 [Blomia tropicalis]|uniref:RING-type domain-containing protein n=1 Tax=Blomia tropicalis TaxID=40697 RepID=A0A9Q0M065_BLOTA|nr:hypothetical protein RDWZM_010032 [Blomia tropicalis]
MDKHRFSLNSLNHCITCRLCNGYLINATAVTECLHTFCRSCLIKYIWKQCARLSSPTPSTSKANTELMISCPIKSCSTKMRWAEPYDCIHLDHTFQELIYKLIPGLYEHEIAREISFYRVNRNSFDIDFTDDDDEDEDEDEDNDEDEDANKKEDEEKGEEKNEKKNEENMEEKMDEDDDNKTKTNRKSKINTKMETEMETDNANEPIPAMIGRLCHHCQCHRQLFAQFKAETKNMFTTLNDNYQDPVVIELITCDEREIKQISINFIRLTPFATIKQVQMMLAIRLWYSTDEHMLLDLLYKDEVLGKDNTLKFIFFTRQHDRRMPMTLRYRFRP